jgi:hypothetical protein
MLLANDLKLYFGEIFIVSKDKGKRGNVVPVLD